MIGAASGDVGEGIEPVGKIFNNATLAIRHHQLEA